MPSYAHQRPAGCTGCPAHESGWAQGWVPPAPPSEPPGPGGLVAFLGQGPGEQEATFGRPFYENAPAGWRLRRWITRAGGRPSLAWIGNVVQCWLPQGFKGGRPYGNRAPTKAEVRHCWRAHVLPALRGADPKWLVPVGAPASGWVGLEGERFVGTVQWKEWEELPDAFGVEVDNDA